MPSLIAVYAGLLVLAPLLRARERHHAPPLRLDLAYWVVSPLFTGALTRAVTLGIIGLAVVARGRTPEDGVLLFDTPVRALPLGVQLVLALGLGDLIGYWSHRLRHRWLWAVHRIHHAPRALSALSAARMHPLDELLDGTLIGAALLAAGFDWGVFAAIGPITLLYTLVSHADVSWDFGRLGHLLVSPRFHRWHHALESGARAVNYSGLFALWDHLFGTYYLPPRDPSALGVEPPLPESLLGQLAAPFRAAAPGGQA